MAVTEAADTYYTAQAATARAVTTALARLWQQVGADFDQGWAQILEQVLAVVTAGQLRAAVLPPLFLEVILSEAGLNPEADAAIRPTAFAGITAAGEPLPVALGSSMIIAKQAVAAGLPPARALERGLQRLTLLAATTVQDAGRGSMQAAMLLEPQIGGYVRRVQLPACGRCIIQAGKFFKKNTGFLRHPRCDCVHVPVAGRADRFQEDSPEELFHGMNSEQQNRAVGADNARAVRAGADLGKVINASSGMRYAGDNFTTASTTARGDFGRMQRDLAKVPGDRYRSTRQRRLSPQGIAHFAGDDLELYLRLLRENGYA